MTIVSFNRLLARIKTEEEAVVELYNMLQPTVLRHIRFQFYNYGEQFAVDATSNYLRSLCNREKTYPYILSPKTWVLAGAENAALRLVEKNHYKEMEAAEIDMNEIASSDTDDDVYQREIDHETCQLALSALSKKERLVVEMHYYADISLKEVAVKLNMNYDAVKQLHHRAKIKMKNSIKNSSEKD